MTPLRLSRGLQAIALILSLFVATMGWANPRPTENLTQVSTKSPGTATAKSTEPAADNEEPGDLLLLDVVVERSMVGASMNAYQVESAVFVPLGELARILTLAIQVDVRSLQAQGFILSPQRTFKLDLVQNQITMSGRVEAVDPSAYRIFEGDVYIDISLLENWWPVRLRADKGRQVLEVTPREQLPLQLRVLREKAARTIGRGSQAVAQLPKVGLPYTLASWPAVDHTLALTGTRTPEASSATVTSTNYVTGDLLGMEAAAYVSLSSAAVQFQEATRSQQASARVTLGRTDPDGRALPFLSSTSFALGHVLMPGVSHLLRSSVAGLGFSVGNLPLERGTNFSTTSLQGELPPGWDVQLFFNEALVGYQAARADGRYSFTDLPLLFGENRFRLEFNGPQGQRRVETRNYNLDSSVVRPGELLYNVGAHRTLEGPAQAQAQWEYGFNQSVALHGGFALASPRLTLEGRRFGNAGARVFLDGWLLTSEHVRCLSCTQQSHATSFGFNRRLEDGSLTASHTRLVNFGSEVYLAGIDPLVNSTKMRYDTALHRTTPNAIPIVAQLQVDNRRSGVPDARISARAGHLWRSASMSHELSWQTQARQKSTRGTFQVNRPTATTSLRGQLDYQIRPQGRLENALLSADRRMESGRLLNVQLLHNFQRKDTTVALLINQSFQAFSVRVGVSQSSSGQTVAAVQLFTSVTRDTGTNRWNFSSLPSANSGAASARVFLDRNLNGVFDPGEAPIAGAAFFVNGAGTAVRTDTAGLAYLPRLPANRRAGISLNATSLEDSNWSPAKPGVTLMPRSGRVQTLEFPVVIAAEVDGYVQLETKNELKGVSDVQLELYASDGTLTSRVRSTADGYFLFSGIPPGRYTLRVAQSQIERLRLLPVAPITVNVSAEGDSGSGHDITLRKAGEKS
jgi:hypothetical protein